jgi:hypothetical protein
MEKSPEEDTQPQFTAEEYKNQGNTLLRDGKIEEAIAAYTSSIGKPLLRPYILFRCGDD